MLPFPPGAVKERNRGERSGEMGAKKLKYVYTKRGEEKNKGK
jgi:hypothetical protein